MTRASAVQLRLNEFLLTIARKAETKTLSIFHDVLMAERLSAAPLQWKHIQESFKARRIMADGAIVFAGSEFVFAGHTKPPSANRAWGR
jgi:hypothetical protein